MSETSAPSSFSAPDTPARSLKTRRLFGFDFVDADDVLDVARAITAGPARSLTRPGFEPVVVTPNVDYVVQLDRGEQHIRRLVHTAQWCLPDGQPIVWASRILRTPLHGRLAGSTLVETLWTHDEFASLRYAVVASSAELAREIGDRDGHTAVVAAPRLAPDPGRIDEYVAGIVHVLAAAKPALVFVGIGFPKDQFVIDALLRSWPADVPVPVLLGIGGSFDMLFGLKRRAPDCVQRFGLEWLYRFAQEPRRLFIRYFVRDPAFLAHIAREWRSRRRHAGRLHQV